MAHLRHFVALHYLGRDWHKASFDALQNSDAIGATTDIGRREGRIGSGR